MTGLGEHHNVPICGCVYRHLNSALGLLEDARGRSKLAAELLDGDEACTAVDLLNAAGTLRRKAEDHVKAAVRAIEHPQEHHEQTTTLPLRTQLGSGPTTAT